MEKLTRKTRLYYQFDALFSLVGDLNSIRAGIVNESINPYIITDEEFEKIGAQIDKIGDAIDDLALIFDETQRSDKGAGNVR